MLSKRFKTQNTFIINGPVSRDYLLLMGQSHEIFTPQFLSLNLQTVGHLIGPCPCLSIFKYGFDFMDIFVAKVHVFCFMESL